VAEGDKEGDLACCTQPVYSVAAGPARGKRQGQTTRADDTAHRANMISLSLAIKAWMADGVSRTTLYKREGVVQPVTEFIFFRKLHHDLGSVSGTAYTIHHEQRQRGTTETEES